jgi:hypothetical protein
MRIAASAVLADLGGPAAVEALSARLGFDDVLERTHAACALGWLGDRRALPALRGHLFEDAGMYRHRSWCGRAPVLPFLRSSSERDRAEVLAMLSSPDNRHAAATFVRAMHRTHPEELAARVATRAPDLLVYLPELVVEPSSAIKDLPQPIHARTISKLAIRMTPERPPGGESPAGKFGGQPDWLAEPQWPVTDDGRPLIFYGQLALPGPEPKVTYIFISADEHAPSYATLSAGNALVVQPGPGCHLPTIASAIGPELFDFFDDGSFVATMRRRRQERFVVLEEGLDPPDWTWPELEPGAQLGLTIGDWNKVGGTPLFLQSEDDPPGDGWRFAFQFTAERVGRELADGAECYGFVNANGTGAFSWQCH